MGGSSWAAVLVLVVFVFWTNIGLVLGFAAGNFVFNALVGFSTPVVSAAFLSVGVVAGSISVVSS